MRERKEGPAILELSLNSIPQTPETLAAPSADGSERCLAKEEGGRLGVGRGIQGASCSLPYRDSPREGGPPSQLSSRSERQEEDLVSGQSPVPA